MNRNTAPAAPAPRRFIFEYQQEYPVRVVELNGDPWFVAADVCAAVGIAHVGSAMRAIDGDEKGVHSTHTLGGQQKITIISESGLYTLILRCRDATTPGTVAHRFRKWVTAEVLPTLRRTGRYDLPAIAAPRPQSSPDSRDLDDDDETLAPWQRRKLRAAVQGIVKAAHGGKVKDIRRLSGEYQHLYRRLHQHFGVHAFTDIPYARFNEAMDLLLPSNQGLAPTQIKAVTELLRLLEAVRTDLANVSELALAAIGMINDTCAEAGAPLQAA